MIIFEIFSSPGTDKIFIFLIAYCINSHETNILLPFALPYYLFYQFETESFCPYYKSVIISETRSETELLSKTFFWRGVWATLTSLATHL